MRLNIRFDDHPHFSASLMNKFHVYLKKAGPIEVSATSFKEDALKQRIEFFQDDSEIAFFSTVEVVGIHLIEKDEVACDLEAARETIQNLLERTRGNQGKSET